jgi:hypothetical protein
MAAESTERRRELGRSPSNPHGLEEIIMTIFSLCVFSCSLNPDPDAAAEVLRAAGFKVYRLPSLLKVALEFPGDDFLEIRREGADDEGSLMAMRADAERIVSVFGGGIDCSGAQTIAELWGYGLQTPPTSVESDDAEPIPFFDDDDEDLEMLRREALNQIESAIANLKRARGRIPEANVNVNEVEVLTRVVAHCAEEAVRRLRARLLAALRP